MPRAGFEPSAKFATYSELLRARHAKPYASRPTDTDFPTDGASAFPTLIGVTIEHAVDCSHGFAPAFWATELGTLSEPATYSVEPTRMLVPG